MRERSLAAGATEGAGPRGRVVLGVVVVLLLAVSAALGFRAGLDDDPSPAEGPPPAPANIGSPPAELPAVGSAIESRLTADGDVVVTQWIRSRSPVSDLALRTPPNGTGSARVGDVTVVADGRTVPPIRDGAEPTLRFALTNPAGLVYVRYALAGAVDRRSSVPGRALVRSSFLRVDYRPRQGPTVVTVKAPEVLSMTCSAPRSLLAPPRPCGSPTAGGWRVTLRQGDRQDDVMAQVGGLRG